MTLEKEFKRETGETVKVSITLYVDLRGSFWSVGVWVKKKGKRLYGPISDKESATMQEIEGVKNEILQMVKSTFKY